MPEIIWRDECRPYNCQEETIYETHFIFILSDNDVLHQLQGIKDISNI